MLVINVRIKINDQPCTQQREMYRGQSQFVTNILSETDSCRQERDRTSGLHTGDSPQHRSSCLTVCNTVRECLESKACRRHLPSFFHRNDGSDKVRILESTSPPADSGLAMDIDVDVTETSHTSNVKRQRQT